MRRLIIASAIMAAAVFGTSVAKAAPIALVLDAREAPSNIIHVSETIPVAHPGPLTLSYPKWIPGEHGPTGPIANLAGLRIASPSGQLPWQRDLVDLDSFHVVVPAGVSTIHVTFDHLMTSDDRLSTPSMVDINWNRDLVYPLGKAADIRVAPSIVLPAGWDFGTALAGPKRDGDRIDFDETSLTTLIDSPLDAGRYFRRIPLLDAGGFTNEIDAVADSPEDLAMTPAELAAFKNLVLEADALYGARHWQHYHFLLTMSDVIGFQGIEHHQSSDNREAEDYWTNPDELEAGFDLLPHEFSHSWNGKYRRPAGLITSDYQVPEKTDLLWVYEGLNQYLGDMLSFRCGLVAPKTFPELLAAKYAGMDHESGRLADPLADTAAAAPYLYQAPREWSSRRRTADDFYTEGELLWLSADAIIRDKSRGTRSLDDFLKAFDGQRTTPPMVVPYTRADVESALEAVQPYDWHGFFQTWVYDVAPHPPAFGIDLTGWRLTWSATPNRWEALDSQIRHGADYSYSLGFRTDSDGRISDVLEGSPAALAGIGPDTQIIAVDGVKYSPSRMHDALSRAKTSPDPIVLIVQTTDRYRVVNVDYHGGERHPHLERVPGTTDVLAQIMAAHRPH